MKYLIFSFLRSGIRLFSTRNARIRQKVESGVFKHQVSSTYPATYGKQREDEENIYIYVIYYIIICSMQGEHRRAVDGGVITGFQPNYTVTYYTELVSDCFIQLLLPIKGLLYGCMNMYNISRQKVALVFCLTNIC